jgi:acyl carrier protein
MRNSILGKIKEVVKCESLDDIVLGEGSVIDSLDLVILFTELEGVYGISLFDLMYKDEILSSGMSFSSLIDYIQEEIN